MTEHAKEILGAPEDWEGFVFEAIGTTGTQPAKLVRVRGAVAPLFSKGKRKGERNWRKMDKSSIKEAFYTPDEHEKWLLEWENKTGKCSRCTGDGEVFSGWSAKDGTRKKQCPRCGGTGRVEG